MLGARGLDSLGQPIEFIALAIHPDVMQRAAYERSSKTIVLKAEPNLSDQVVVNLVHAIHSEIRSECPAGPLLGESLATDLSAYLLRQHAIEPIHLPYFKGGIPRGRLNRVLEYVEASLATKLRVAELAGISEMSPYYFGKLFKQSTGLTVHEYVTKRRVQRASDGKRFLMNVLAEEQERTSFRVVLNWPALLKR